MALRIGVNLGPGPDWTQTLDAVRRAEDLGLDAVSALDHYHSDREEWGWLSGWAYWGALAVSTSRVCLVPLVIDRLNHLPGVLAKETAVLSQLSAGRFELGIGAGDYFVEQRAWGLPVPDATSRIDAMAETVSALRRIWNGETVTTSGEFINLSGARCRPVPAQSPRVVIGAGSSRSLIRAAVAYADELNVYADDVVVTAAREAIDASGRSVGLSVYVWDWPSQLEKRLADWAELGVERVFLTVWPPYDSMAVAAALHDVI